MSLTQDAGFKVIDDGIKVDITTAIENKRWRAAIVLIYSAMDTMAFLDLPPGKVDVHGRDFIRWAGKYIRFPCKEQLTGEDLYGARCAMLHTNRVISKLSREGKCRMVGYTNLMIPEVRYNPAVSTTFVMVSTVGLKDALFNGINQYLIHVYSDKAKATLVNGRIQEMVQLFDKTSDPE